MNSRLLQKICTTKKFDVLNSMRMMSTTNACASSIRNPFHRKSKYLQRERAAVIDDHEVYDYVKDSVGEIIADKMFDIKNDLKVVMDLGCGKGHFSKHIPVEKGTTKLIMTDFSPSLLKMAKVPRDSTIEIMKKVVDEEKKFPFENNIMDLVVSSLSMHWVNNLPGCLSEVYRVLKRNGAFMLALFGEDTLYELRSSLVLAELEREGGFAPHISPFIKIDDLGSLLSKCGFTLLTFETQDLTIGYPSIYELMFDLKGMAENNASINRKLHLPRDTIMAAAAIYQHMFGDERGIPATFQVYFCIGWKPDPNQPVHYAQRGSGTVSMKDIKHLNEMIEEHGMEGKIKYMKEAMEKDPEDKK